VDRYYLDKQSEETKIKRGDYYKSLGDDVSRMIAYEVPDRQFYDLGMIQPG